MYKEVLSGIDGIGIWPTISFVVFFLFFIILSFWILKSKKDDFDDISRTPLSDEGNSVYESNNMQ